MMAATGMLPLSDRALEVLRPEVEQRLRFVVQEALKLASHANREVLLPRDLELAYNTWCRTRGPTFEFKRATPPPRTVCTLQEVAVPTYRSLFELLGVFLPMPPSDRGSRSIGHRVSLSPGVMSYLCRDWRHWW